MVSALELLPIILAVTIAFYLFMGYLGTSYVVGRRPEWGTKVPSSSKDAFQVEEVAFPSKDGILLRASWVPTDSPRATIILAHGSGANRSHMMSRASFLHRNRYNVLTMDLRAHGDSEGNYMSPGYMEALDIIGGVSFLRQHGHRGLIVAYGHSYGAVASIQAAVRSPEIGAVIADSPFITLSDMMQRSMKLLATDPTAPPGLKFGLQLMKMPFLPQASRLMFYLRTGVNINPQKASALWAVSQLGSKPVLFLAGEHDPIAPPENTRLLYQTAKSPIKDMMVVPARGHSTYEPGLSSYEEKVLEFLGNVVRFVESGKRLHEMSPVPP